MDVVIDFVLVVAICAFGIGITKAIIFGLLFLVAMLFAPTILLFLTGLLYNAIKILVSNKKQNINEASADELVSSLRNGKKIGLTGAFIVYAAILGVTFYLGSTYFLASLVGIIFKLLIDSVWGDLPFQKPKIDPSTFRE